MCGSFADRRYRFVLPNKDRVAAVKRAMADVLCFVGATAVVMFAFAVLIVIVQEQNALVLARTYFLRACTFAAELVKQDPEAVSLLVFFVGLIAMIMARSSCQLPRQQWEPTHHASRRPRPGSLDLKIPQPTQSSQTLSVLTLVKQLLQI